MSFVKAIPPKMLHDQMGLYSGQWMPEMDKAWIDYERDYSVCSRMIATKWGNVEHVTITKVSGGISTGGSNPISWSEKMMIKNELFGENRIAIEVYPKQNKLVDITDTYHLWVFNKKFELPFGIHPSQYTKAINRGATFYEEDMAALLLAKKENNF